MTLANCIHAVGNDSINDNNTTSGNEKCIEILVKNGADVNTKIKTGSN